MNASKYKEELKIEQLPHQPHEVLLHVTMKLNFVLLYTAIVVTEPAIKRLKNINFT